MILRHVKAYVAALLLMPGPTVVAEDTPELFGKYKAWQAVSYASEGKKTCYMVSRPLESTPTSAARGDIYVMVTRHSGEPVDKVSVRIGYPFRRGTAAEVRIGPRVFRLVTSDKYAWPADGTIARELIKSMRAGKKLMLTGISSRGTRTTDTFSLLGFTAAHRAIIQQCR